MNFPSSVQPDLSPIPAPTTQFPYNRKTNTIRLPRPVEQELRNLVAAGRKVEAVKRVTELTGARLRLSKAYVDSLDLKR